MTRDEFRLTPDHLTLLQHMYVGWQDMETGAPEIDPKRPYGNDYVADDICELLGYPTVEANHETVYLTAELCSARRAFVPACIGRLNGTIHGPGCSLRSKGGSPMRHRLILAGLSAWILWSYNMPDPEWLALGAAETQRACTTQLHQLNGITGVSATWQLRCLPAGLSPDQVHGLYDLNMARPQDEGE